MTPDAAEFLLREALDGLVEISRVEALGRGFRVVGRLRHDDPDHATMHAFAEELAEDTVNAPVLVEGPALDPSLPRMVWKPVLDAADRPEDVVQVLKTGAGLRIVARHQPLTLGRKRNRLPRLEQELQHQELAVVPLGPCTDAAELRSLDEVRSLPLVAAGLDPEALHDHRADPRRQRLQLWLDAPDAGPIALARAARHLRDATDLAVEIEHRISKTRAREEVVAALEALPWVQRHKTSWSDRVRGVHAKIEADPDHAEAIQALQDRLQHELGVPVGLQLDVGRSLLVDRIARAFPEHGILTRVKHVDEQLYEVHGLVRLEPPTTLEAWSDKLEAEWGVEVMLEEPRMFAPDLRFADERGADEATIARRYNRPSAFPPAALQGAVAAANAFDPTAGRRDIRELCVMSIDPKRTKDLDDALSIDEHPEGGWQIGVHIADVVPFVAKDGALDQEALLRSFTTYLSVGEIPVLPAILSSGLCSLHGGQDSPALSLFVRVDDDGVPGDFHLEHTYLHNHHRLHYAQAQGILDGADHPEAWRVRKLGELAQKLRARRKAAGSLDLSLEPDPEAPSHQLIEEFMLLANECVARFLDERHPDGLCLYRTHPHVREADWKALDEVGRFLGAETRIRDQGSMQAALEELVGEEGYEVLRFHVGRVLEKASYHTEQLGHGALAKLHYAHFTSPIRRYSDLVVHRLIDDALRGEGSSYTREELAPVCEHLNRMEIRVDAASFESHKLADLSRFEGGGRTEPARILGLMNGRIWLRLESTDLRVSARYRDSRMRPPEMPTTATDQQTGMAFRLGGWVMVSTRGIDWGRKAVHAAVLGPHHPAIS